MLLPLQTQNPRLLCRCNVQMQGHAAAEMAHFTAITLTRDNEYRMPGIPAVLLSLRQVLVRMAASTGYYAMNCIESNKKCDDAAYSMSFDAHSCMICDAAMLWSAGCSAAAHCAPCST
jgi:hypothetical protein